jgi:hypothetical protein
MYASRLQPQIADHTVQVTVGFGLPGSQGIVFEISR